MHVLGSVFKLEGFRGMRKCATLPWWDERLCLRGSEISIEISILLLIG